MTLFNISNQALAEILISEGYTYQQRNSDDEPYCFIGSDACRRALKLLLLIGRPIPITLSIMEADVICKLLDDNPQLCEFYDIKDCSEKISKAVWDTINKETLDNLRAASAIADSDE